MRCSLALIALIALSACPMADDDDIDEIRELLAADDDDVTDVCDESHPDWTVGLQFCDPRAEAGYTLLAPLRSSTTYLLDLRGRQVASWQADEVPGNAAYLVPGGGLLRAAFPDDNPDFAFAGGTGGRVQEFAADGGLLWDFRYSDEVVLQHHDVERLPDGHVILVAWERKTEQEAIAAGRDPDLLGDGELWVDHLVEVDPATDAIVWEWHLWDHLVQDFDPSADNHGVVADHPERVDINYGGAGPDQDGADWNHVNSVAYNPELDQLLLSAHNQNELWIIDHSTGDLLYRWGNPEAWGAGSASDRVLSGQHDARWIEEGLPGAGNILVFNNRHAQSASAVLELVPPLQDDGTYDRSPGEAWGPGEPVWSYLADDFYSGSISGAHRLPGGDTLICEGATGRLFEVTTDGEIVWQYVNPVLASGPVDQGDELPFGPNGTQNQVFKAQRYAPGAVELQGLALEPGDYVEGP